MSWCLLSTKHLPEQIIVNYVCRKKPPVKFLSKFKNLHWQKCIENAIFTMLATWSPGKGTASLKPTNFRQIHSVNLLTNTHRNTYSDKFHWLSSVDLKKSLKNSPIWCIMKMCILYDMHRICRMDSNFFLKIHVCYHLVDWADDYIQRIFIAHIDSNKMLYGTVVATFSFQTVVNGDLLDKLRCSRILD